MIIAGMDGVLLIFDRIFNDTRVIRQNHGTVIVITTVIYPRFCLKSIGKTSRYVFKLIIWGSWGISDHFIFMFNEILSEKFVDDGRLWSILHVHTIDHFLSLNKIF